MKKLIYTIFIFLFVLSCQSKSEKKIEISEIKVSKKETQVPKLTEYVIEISAVDLGNRNVKVKIDTDFPDGTNLLLSVGRTHYLKGSDEAYSGDIYSKDFKVEQGKIETTVEINDSKWYNYHQNLVKELPNDFQPISKIADNIDIDILFTPARNESSEVLKILGSKGEFVSGKGAEKFGFMTILKASTEFNVPFKK